MGSRRVRHLVSNTVGTVTLFVANATNLVPHRKILLAFAAVVVIASVPMLFRADVPSVAANSTLKCYDSAWKYEPCAARASVSPSRFADRTIGVQLPASLTVTALNEEERWTTPAADPPADSKVSAPAAINQPENSKVDPPAARRVGPPRKRLASAGCGRRPIGCFFSALRRKVTHLAAVAAIESGSRSARGGYQSKNL
jgi:hypothetical protein